MNYLILGKGVSYQNTHQGFGSFIFFRSENPLIAALSSKLIVVEAAKRKIGALITTNLALGMAVMSSAMVGAFNSPQSEGCYELMGMTGQWLLVMGLIYVVF